MIATWQDYYRTDVTVSLPSQGLTDAAVSSMIAALPDGCGCNVTRGVGVWEGAQEPSATVSLVGDDWTTLPAAECLVDAAHAAGCIAVQVERWTPSGYSATEYRQANTNERNTQ